MLDGRPLIDVHLHPARRRSLKIDWETWLQGFDTSLLASLYDSSGDVRPAAFDLHLAGEGVVGPVLTSAYSQPDTD